MSEREKSRRRLRKGTRATLATLSLPAAVRRIDARRQNNDHIDGDGLDLEHIELMSTDGTRLHMTACGEGDETLIFVHGWTCNE
ncbi:MAG: alpha/beta fold hydrolase, partial [Candidatus Geothermincolia bacterium]